MAQGFKFLAGQLPTSSTAYSLEAQRTEGHAPQRCNIRADSGKHSPHLPVPPFAQRYFVIHPVTVTTKFVQRLGMQSLAIVQNTVAELLRCTRWQRRRRTRFVDFLDAVARVRHGQRQRAIVGYQQQPFAVAVKTPDGIKAAAILRQVVQNRSPSLGVMAGTKHVMRLVQQQINHPFGSQGTSIEGNGVVTRIERHAHLRDDFSIHGHPSGGNPAFAGTSRTRAALRHPDVQTQFIQAWFWGVQRHSSPRPICRVW